MVERVTFPSALNINDVPHKVVEFRSLTNTFDAHSGAWYTFIVDSPDHPGMACSEHSLSGYALNHIVCGWGVKTGGNHYGPIKREKQ